MPWLKPKVDWSAPDGVRDTDMNRIEGNILELAMNSAVADITVYVTKSGSDTVGDGTSELPYATITKALSMVPKSLNGKTVILNIGEGTYAEDVVVKGFHGGTLVFKNNSSASIMINSLKISESQVEFTNSLTIHISSSYGFKVERGARLISFARFVCNGGGLGLEVSHSSVAQMYELICGNVSQAVNAFTNSRVHIAHLSGSASVWAMVASSGSIISYEVSDITADSYSTGGGRIYTGSQDYVATNTYVANATLE